jgi:hypothetical protein
MTTRARTDGAQATPNDTTSAPELQPITRPYPLGRSVGARCCPTCSAVLDGGPVLFWCSTCQASVHAADLSRETCRPLSRRAVA